MNPLLEYNEFDGLGAVLGSHTKRSASFKFNKLKSKKIDLRALPGGFRELIYGLIGPSL